MLVRTPAESLETVPPPSPPDTAAAPLRTDSPALLQGRRELVIRHGDQFYRLRLTQSGKLILTK